MAAKDHSNLNGGMEEPEKNKIKLTRSSSRLSNRSKEGDSHGKYLTTANELSILANERNRLQLAQTLEDATEHGKSENDPEAPFSVMSDLLRLVERIRAVEGSNPPEEHSPEQVEGDAAAEAAAEALCGVVLGSSSESGIESGEVEDRRAVFGTNAIAAKELSSFLKLCWEAVQDFVLVMLLVLGVLTIIVETTIALEPGEKCGACWVEGAAILVSVCIVVLVTAGIDYGKQFAFIRLTQSLNETNTKSVIRDGKQMLVTDEDIVVGDIVSVNSHNLASIPADCILLGPDAGLKMDESTLTGESKQISKRPGDVILSGTTAVQGNGKMLVIAVGVNSVSGKIRARVYDSEDHKGDLEGEDEDTPLGSKLDKIAKQIGLVGIIAAALAFVVSSIIGLAINRLPAREIIQYLILGITVLAVAVPEGLPLAVTLALAFSSNKMTKEQNLVKHLDACETMGSATTICTDKTGTLTANKMTARALWALEDYVCNNPSLSLGEYVKTFEGGAPENILELIAKLISVDTMDETVLRFNKTGKVEGSSGNPTEVALLNLCYDLGFNYETIRNSVRGRSDHGELAHYRSEGKQFGFSSGRKMMSWAVPLDGGGYRLYCKGAFEVVISRCTKLYSANGEPQDLDAHRSTLGGVGLSYTRRGMRCLGLAYRDLPLGFDLEQLSNEVNNSDGTKAFEAETNLVAVGMVGIEDPLRHEVPDAIEKCYQAGIDVRLVTGDNPETAVSIAYQAGILRDEHFVDLSDERVSTNLKENILMEGRDFRSRVTKNDEFDQESFDEIWPHLRVLARSSPDDKLTLAHGLNKSNLYADKEVCQNLLRQHNIKIFPDRQVVAMTGDGTNDAPALKRADIGFAMGISGTQIAKDAADIILLDDNFASIVTAAKWGRNIYASIQKFLQFQLTVNISAVVTALVGAFSHQTSPLAAIQLLWVNLLMDSLASLALASEPPVDSLLQRPPVNRTDHMVTKRMWANMLGQASYQIIVVMTLLFAGPRLLNLEPGHEVEARKENSIHYTIIFNSFVWMQLFNEINCRNLKGELNVFRGMQNNPLFIGILLTTMVLQVLIVQFGSLVFHVSDGGLEGKFWGLSLILGVGSLPWQQVINLFYRAGLNCRRKQSAEATE